MAVAAARDVSRELGYIEGTAVRGRALAAEPA